MIKLNHKNLDVYKASIELVTEVYRMTDSFPKSETFGLISQLRRAAVSVPSNIAEGSSRTSNVEKKRFYQISRSSLVELDTQFEIALNLNYLDGDELIKLSDLSNQTFAMLTKMMK
jgi:four helix bundle protein